MTDDLTQYLCRVDALRGLPVRSTRLAGLTNINHLVETSDDRYVLRIPGMGTEEYLDRVAEATAARVASEAGVNAELIHFDATDGLMVTRFVEGAVTMSPERFRDLGAVERAGRAFRRLHDCDATFATDFRLFEMIDEYKALLAHKGAALPYGYDDAVTRSEAVRALLADSPVAFVPCHCDPLCENFLDTGEQMFIIDYEYAGNNDPMWDLGDLSVEGEFDAEQDAALLRAYFNDEPPVAQVARMVIYKALCDLLWTLWGLIQHVNENPTDDYEAYALNRFGRCEALMSSPEFATHLANIGS